MWWQAVAVFWIASIAFVAGLFVGSSSERTYLVQTPSLDRLNALTPTARN